jgi:DNA-directed RNA polymerase beta' subunit
MDKLHAMKMFEQIPVYHDFSQYPRDNLFTGRDIVSILLIETGNLINFKSQASIFRKEQAPFRSYSKSEINVEIDRGKLVSGVLDKSSVGEGGQGGIFHIIHNKYGPDAALDACWNVQQLALAYLYQAGLTVSVGDFIIRDESLREVREIEARLIADSLQITKRLNDGKIVPPLGKTIEEHYEEMQMNALNAGDEFWKPIITGVDHKNNNLYQLIFHGSKGKALNFMSMASAIGQVDMNSARMPEKFGGRTLPYFTRYDSDPRARGYVTNSYITGSTCEELFLNAQQARYSLIQKALSTSITGMQNRMSIKNLESMVVDNQRKVMKNKNIIQMLYGADGIDARFLERVKFPTVSGSLGDKEFETRYLSESKSFGSKFNNKAVQKLLDEEFAQLEEDRKWYRERYLLWEANSGNMFSDRIAVPVNIPRIISDIVYNMRLKSPTPAGSLDPVRTIEMVQNLCKNIIYVYMNAVQEKRQTAVPRYMQTCTLLVQVLIRAYLNTSNLVREGINDAALDLIINRIRMVISRALISYGKCVGILAAQSISEPMTQMVLDAVHASGAASVRKQGMFRIKEILGAKPTEKMKSPSMFINVLPQFRTNRLKVQEIANHIEMLPLRQFVRRWQIFYEKYAEPIHPDYVQEKKIFAEFAKYNKYAMDNRPKDLAPWCIRIVLDKGKMILKQMKMETIYTKIRQLFPWTFIVYTTDNAPEVILRIYVRNIIAKKSHITTDQMKDVASEIIDTVMRGVEGIKAAYVQPKNISELHDDGTVSTVQAYEIFTDGTNLEKILENPYIDPCNTHSDSIIETAQIFGIASARNKVLNELRFQVDAASYRHYTVYADEMTFTGFVTSIDRYGSAKRDASVMLRISDASPIAVIEESAINGHRDPLKGVSPPIMVGKKPRIGDLYNSFVLDEDFVKNNVQNLEDILADL